MANEISQEVLLRLSAVFDAEDAQSNARATAKIILNELKKIDKGARFDVFKNLVTWLGSAEDGVLGLKRVIDGVNWDKLFGENGINIDKGLMESLAPVRKFLDNYIALSDRTGIIGALQPGEKGSLDALRAYMTAIVDLYRDAGLDTPFKDLLNDKLRISLDEIFKKADGSNLNKISNEAFLAYQKQAIDAIKRFSDIGVNFDWGKLFDLPELDRAKDAIGEAVEFYLKEFQKLQKALDRELENDKYNESLVNQLENQQDIIKQKVSMLLSGSKQNEDIWDLVGQTEIPEDEEKLKKLIRTDFVDEFVTDLSSAKELIVRALTQAGFGDYKEQPKPDVKNKKPTQAGQQVDQMLSELGDLIEKFGNKIKDVGGQAETAADQLNILFEKLKIEAIELVRGDLNKNSVSLVDDQSDNSSAPPPPDNAEAKFKELTPTSGYALDTAAREILRTLGQILGEIRKFNISDELQPIVSEIKGSVEKLNKLTSDIIDPKISESSRYLLENRPEIESRLRSSVSHVGGDDGFKVTKLDIDENGLIQATGYIRTADKEWADFNATLTRSGEVLNSNIEVNKKLSASMNQTATRQKRFQKKLGKRRAELAAFFKAHPEAINDNSFKELDHEINKEIENATELSEWLTQFRREKQRYEPSSKPELNEIKKIVDSDYKSLKIDRYADKKDKIGDQTVAWVQEYYGSLSDDINKTLSGEIDATDAWIEALDKRAKKMREVVKTHKQQIDAAKTSSGALDIDAVQKKAKSLYSSLEISTLNNATVIGGETVENIKKAYDIVNELSTKRKNGHILSDDEDKRLQSSLDLLQRIADIQKNIYGKRKYNTATNRYNNLIDRADIEFGTGSFIVSEAKNKYTEAMNKVNKAWIALQASPDDATLQFNFDEAVRDAQKLSKELENIITTTNKMRAASMHTPIDVVDYDSMSKEDRKEQLRKAVDEFEGGSAKIQGFNNDYTELTYTIKDSDGVIRNMTAAFDKAGTSIVSVANKTTKTQNIFSSMFDTIKSKAKSLLAFVGVDEFIHVFKQGISYVRQIDSAMTELKKVTDETSDTYNKFQDRVAKVAPQVAVTPTEFISSTADWARLGLSLNDAELMAKNTSMLMNVSEFTNIEDATNSLVSAMQAYKYEASDTMEIIDALNAIGNNFAISTADAADSLTRSSAAMFAAGNDLNQTLALTAAANTFVQNPESVGNALKTLSMRIRGTKVELEAAGEETDGMAESTSKLRDQVKALTNVDGSGGFDILTDDGGYKSTYDIVLGIAEVWKKIDDMDQAALLELIAGKQRGSVVAGMLESPELIKEAYATAVDSAGSAAVENEKYLNSVDGKIKILESSFQTLWNNALDDGVLKMFLDLANFAVKAADSVGILSVALSGLLMYKHFLSKNKWDFASGIFGKKDKNGNVIQENILQRGWQKGKDAVGWIYEKKTGKVPKWNIEVNADTSAADKALDDLKQRLEHLKSQAKSDSVNAQSYQTEIDAINKQIADTSNGFNVLEQRFARISKKKVLDLPDIHSLQSHIDEYNSLGSEAERGAWFAQNIDKLNDAEVTYFNTLKGGKASVIDAKDAMNQHNAAIEASSLKAKAASVAHNLLNSAISFGVSMLASFAIEGIISAFTAGEKAAERAANAAEKYKESVNSYQSNAKTIREIGAEYSTLAHGVDELGNNISLSESEFERYNEITNQIADMFPTLIDGYTNQGNAIVNLTSQTEGLTSATAALNAENEKQLKLANAEYIKNAGDTFSTAKGYYQEYDNQTLGALTFGVSRIWEQAGYSEQIRAMEVAEGKRDINTIPDHERTRLLNTWEAAGIADANFFIGDVIGNNDERFEKTLASKKDQIIALGKSVVAERTEAYRNLFQTFKAGLMEFEDFALLDDLAQETLLNYANQISDEDGLFAGGLFANYGTYAESLEHFKSFVPLLKNTNATNIVKDFKQLDSAFKSSEITYAEYEQRYNNLLSNIQDRTGFTKADTQLFTGMIGDLFEIDESEIEPKLNVAEQYVKDLLKQSNYKNLLNDPNFDIDVNNWTISQLDQIYESYEQIGDALTNSREEIESLLGDPKNNPFSYEGNQLKVGNVNLNDLKPNSNFGWKSQLVNGQSYAIHFNPVFDGKEMSGQEIQDYINYITSGTANAQEIFERDAKGKGIILKITPEFQSIEEEDQFSEDLEYYAKKYNYTANNQATIAQSRVSWAMPSSSLSPVASYDTLSSSATNYNSVLTSLNGQIFNNMKLTDEQYSALSGYINDSNALSKAIDTENGNRIKNVEVLQEIIEAKRDDDAATIKQARAQARLRYYELSRDLDDYLDGLKVSADSYGQLTEEQYANARAMQDQLSSLEAIVAQYSVLEAQLLGATNAFSEFTAAQEVDSATDYTSQFTSMLQVISDGFETGRVGTEAFKKAVEGLVPDSVLDGLTNAYDKMTAIENYVANDLGRYFTIDGENFEVNHDDITNFVNDAISKGVFTGTTTKFDIADGIDFETAAEKMNLTKEALFAIIDEINNRNVYGDNLFDDLMANSEDAESQMWAYNRSLVELQEQKAELLRTNKNGANNKAIIEIDAKIDAAEEKILTVSNQVADVVREGEKAEVKIQTILEDKGFRDYQELKKQGLSNEQIEKELGITIKETDYEKTYAELIALEGKLQEVDDLTEYEITIAVDAIDNRLAEIEAELNRGGLTVEAEVKLKDEKTRLTENRELLLGTAKVDTNTVEDELETIQEFTIGDKKFRIIITNGKATLELLDTIENGDDVERKVTLTGMEANEQLLADYEKHILQDGTRQILEAEYGNSNVDLMNRKPVSGATMHAHGYTDVPKNDYATLYTETLTGEQFDLPGTVAFNVTPMLPDGTIIENGKIEDYISKQLAEGKQIEELDIFIGSYDSVKEAEAAAQRLHELQEQNNRDLTTAQKIYKSLANGTRKVDENSTNYAETNNQILNTVSDITKEMYTQSSAEFGIRVKDLTNSLQEAGYDQGTIDEIIGTLNDSFKDSFDFDVSTESIGEATDLLMRLGVQYKGIQEDGKLSLVVDNTSLTNALTQLGYTDQQIAAIKQKWEASGIKVETEFTKRGDDFVGQTAKDLANIPDNTVTTTFVAKDSTSGFVSRIKQLIDQIPSEKKVTFTASTSGGSSSLLSKLGLSFASGNAYATGDGGLTAPAHKALVGELGPELVVDPARNIYRTVGNNGPEMVDLPKGAIIFNHLQTRDLLKNGATKMRGLAMATGNAYTGGLWTPSNGIGNGASGSGAGSGNGDKAKSALDSLLEKYANLFDWIEIKLDRVSKITQQKIDSIDDYTQSIDKTLATANEAIKKVNEEIKVNKQAADKYQKQADKVAKETGLSSDIVNKIQNGSLEIKSYDEDTQKKIDEYQKWYNKAVACKEAVEDLNETEKELYARRFDEIGKYYGNRESTYNFRTSLLDTSIDYREAQGGPQSDDYYIAQVNLAKDNKALLIEERTRLIKELNAQVNSGAIEQYSDEWYTANAQINDVNQEIQELNVTIEECGNKLGEIHFSNFDMLMSQFDALESEISHLYTLMSDNPVTEKEDYYQWTDDAIASIGLQAQAMATAEKKAAEYQKEIEYLDANWKELGYSETEYKEERAGLVDSMWTEIEAIESAKDAIVDLNRRRVDAIKDGIQKEIEAYSKLIAKRKEDLDVQKDAYDWKNSVDEKTKDIDKIDAQLAALEGDTSMAAAAERKKLLEQKAEAEKELADMKYEHNIDTQQKAYDDELEDFQEEKEREIEALEEYLEDVDRVTADSLALIANHGTEIAATIDQTAKDLGISISDAIVSPWKDGEGAMDSFATKLDGIQTRFEQLQEKADANARYDIEYADDRQRSNSGYMEVPPKGAVVQVQSDTAATWSDGSPIAKNERNTDLVVVDTNAAKNLAQLQVGNQKKWINARYLYGYAKGTTGVPRSDFAIVDEGGYEELIMHAGKDGRIEYLTKGSSVVPHDITENLMKLGQLDPTEVLRRNMPKMDVVPMITNNNMEINLDIAEVVHIDHADSNSIPEIENAIEAKLNNYMKAINQSMKRYIR